MGLLSLQMIPWCFHMLHQQQQQEEDDAGVPTTSTGPPSIRTVRLVAPDGRVQVYKRPVPASELMREFPRHLVCHSDSFLIGQKVPALPAEEQLQLGQSYFLLPASFFHSVLSFVTAASSLVVMMTRPADRKTRPPFDIRKTEKGMLQIRISEEVLMEMMIKNDDDNEEEEAAAPAHSFCRVCSSEELEKEYKQLVVVGRRRREEWKSRLETITEEKHNSQEEERRRRRRRRKWLLFGRKKKI